ncbi:GNAT family protein [Solibacillus sp. CAU 1738]|uniref:GNAT family N-acetyltransferase n=1 Tax=Solibacillus sp. CAU 1738 TaxID=3140363 RepID=UPI003260AACE
MFINTTRLIIRNFEANDWQAVYEYTSNSVVMKYIPENVFNISDAKKFVEENRGEKAEKFAVVLKESNELIGHIAFFKYFGEHTYEIGWVFNPKFHSRGFATESAQAMIDYGFIKMDLHRIVATCQPENISSWRVMEKLGMRREGFFKKCIPCDDGWWDEYYYGILKEEYVAL